LVVSLSICTVGFSQNSLISQLKNQAPTFFSGQYKL
jgi:hypothetical protein